MPIDTMTIEQCRQFAARIVNHQRLTKDDRESIRLALLELADRKEKGLYGYCWNCTKRGTCKHFDHNQKYAMVVEYCADHCGDGRH